MADDLARAHALEANLMIRAMIGVLIDRGALQPEDFTAILESAQRIAGTDLKGSPIAGAVEKSLLEQISAARHRETKPS